MIKANIKRDQNQNIIIFFAEGHADFAPEGEDIICSAVSAILQTAVFGLVNYLNLEPDIEVKDGWLNCQLSSDIAQDSQVKAILETMLVGLKETEKVYPKYLKVIEGGGSNA